MGPAQWLAMAREDLQAADLLAQHGIPRLSCFHSGQAVEKALLALRLYQEAHDGPDSRFQQEADDWLPGTGETAIEQLPWELASRGDISMLHGKNGGPDSALAHEAVGVARRLIGQITDRIYGAVSEER